MANDFVIDEFGAERVSVNGRSGWKNTKVMLDGKEVLSVPTKKELKKGCEVQTEAGKLHIQLKSGFLREAVHVALDGRQLQSDPAKQFKASYSTIYVISIVSIVFGGLGALAHVDGLGGFGWPSIAIGILFGALGFWTQRRLSLVALSIAFSIFAIDSIATFVPQASQSGTDVIPSSQSSTNPPVGIFLVKILFLFEMSKGFRAIPRLRRRALAMPSRMSTGAKRKGS